MPLENLVLLQVLGQRHLDRAVEGQVAGVDPFERVDDVTEGPIALQHLAAEALAGDLDLLGQGDFLIAVEQWDFAHLRQVHADRIVDAPAVFLVHEAEFQFGRISSSEAAGRAGGLALLGLRFVDQLDALLFEKDQDLIDLLGIGVVIRQMVVDLIVGQEALFLARLEQSFQAVIGLFHQTLLAS